MDSFLYPSDLCHERVETKYLAEAHLKGLQKQKKRIEVLLAIEGVSISNKIGQSISFPYKYKVRVYMDVYMSKSIWIVKSRMHIFYLIH